jgi:mevalonate kinase
MSVDFEKTAWPAKLLIFGEYVILDGGMALGMPLTDFSLQVKSVDSNTPLFSSDIQKVWNVLTLNKEQSPPHALVIDSTIPIGQGLGSSAALCLALYQWGVSEKRVANRSFEERYALLRQMESVYHESSSGVDILIAAATGPVVLEMGRIPKVHTTQMRGKIWLNLIDVGKRKEKNRSWIPKVLRKFKENSEVWSSYALHTSAGIESMVSGSHSELNRVLTELRNAQEKVGILSVDLHAALPNEKSILGWKAVGAGGGGLVLMFSTEKIEANAQPFPLIWQGTTSHV